MPARAPVSALTGAVERRSRLSTPELAPRHASGCASFPAALARD
jgi:hypothetical protein